MSEQKQETPSLRRNLTAFDGIALLIGITIGAGIYSTPQIIATYQDAFSSILLLWVLAGVFVIIGGLIYAELGARLPYTGGEYVYIHRVFGPFAGFIFGWAQLFIIRTSPAAGLALIAANYIGYFIPLAGWVHTATALLVIVCIGILNYTGIQYAGLFQRVTTVLKVVGLFILAFGGMLLIQDTAQPLDTTLAPTASLGPVGNTVAAIMLVLFSYIGWDRVGYVAGEMKNPKRTIPIALITGLSCTVLIYIATVTMYHMTLGLEGVRSSTIVASDAATQFVGPMGVALVSILVIISVIGSINGTYMSASRVYYAMAHDGLFFKWLDHIHPRFRTPSRAVLAHGIWGAVILLVRGSFETIVAGMVFAILTFYILTTIALFKLRMDEEDGYEGFKMPFYPILPAIYLLGLIALVVLRAVFEWQNSLMDLAFIATGVPVSWFWLRKKPATE